MKSEQSIAIMKALADQSRLAIINSLLERSQYVEEIAKRHGLAPSTVSFHLRKLEQAGLVSSRKEQYYVVIQANDAIFDTTLREIVSAPAVGRELQDGRMEEYRRKVLETFFRHGMLDKLPTQHKKRLIVLEQFASRFEPEQRYSEQEVTGLIMPLFDDYCTIRRLLVDEGLIRREGATYWLEEKAGEPVAQSALPVQTVKGSSHMPKDSTRADLKRLYKQNTPNMGIYQIKNKANGKIYIDSSTNLDGTRNSRMFQIKMGKIVFSRELQKDVTAFGADSFEFSVLDVLDKPEPGDNVKRLLAALELHWLEKLQPFGERGYNSAKAFERNMQELWQQSGITLPVSKEPGNERV
ncbi:MAG: metalloregulator ArsR/SmtB family transcription factor [Desulfuromonadaceae bacterium]|nr:metalloregulator ArsR/SmtB family transcription factor [Desulfuromonadaceae bacterium]MDD5105633.1 metalloregulator ArsR/SmtB family transcription factor [Desulfuromonadaceae bacterium]